MAVQLLGYYLNEQAAFREASSPVLISMEHLNRSVSNEKQRIGDCQEIAQFADPKVRKAISVLIRYGHARFRRAPAQIHTQPPPPPLTQIQAPIEDSGNGQHVTPHPHFHTPQTINLFSVSPPSPDARAPAASQPLKNHFAEANGGFVKNNRDLMSEEGLSLSATVSTSGKSFSTFASTITGEGSVSNGKAGSPPPIIPSVFSSAKPPLPRKRCREHNHSDNIFCKSSDSSRCHCTQRRNKVRKAIRVPAINSRIADIPADEYSWRKYDQKPLKGSPYPRGYYKCSSVRGCPARKLVERAKDDPTVLILTYEGKHRHTEVAIQEIPACRAPDCCR